MEDTTPLNSTSQNEFTMASKKTFGLANYSWQTLLMMIGFFIALITNEPGKINSWTWAGLGVSVVGALWAIFDGIPKKFLPKI